MLRRPRQYTICLLGAAVLIFVISAAGSARAGGWPRESTPTTVPTYEMPRPDYDRPGVRVGDFLLFPALSESAEYDDNIFASDRHVAGDFVNTTGEEFGFASDWQRDSLGGRVFSAQQVFADHADEDANTYGAEASGRLDVMTDGFLQLDGGFVQQPQLRALPEASTAAQRPIYNTGTTALNFFQRFSRWVERAQASFVRIDYVTSGNTSRDATTQAYNDRVSYDLSEELSVFAQTGYLVRDWDLRPSERNFQTLTGLVGFSAEIPTVLEVDFGVGVLRQDFTNNAFEPLVTPVVSGHLLWNVMPLTSILAAVDRTATGTETFCGTARGPCQPAGSTQTIAPGTGARSTLEITTADVGVQHEFVHDILGDMHFRYEQDVFDFNNLVDNNYVVTTNARYLISRHLEADLDYTYRVRTANIPNDPTFNSGAFTENVIAVVLKTGF